MLGGLYGLDKKQKQTMGMVQLAPTIVSTISLFLFKNSLLALIFLQLFAYLLTPYLYIKHVSKEKELSPFFLNEFRERRNQIKVGSSLFMSGICVVFMAYIFIYEFRTKIIYMLDIPVSYNPIYMVLFIFCMAIINPILEEWFWRIFITKIYQDHEINSWMINANYAFFHFCSLCCVVNWKVAIGLTSTFFSIGRSFEYIQKKYGFITTCMTHLGVSIAASICLLDIFYLEHAHEGQMAIDVVM